MGRGKRNNTGTGLRPDRAHLDVPGAERGFKLSERDGLTLIAPPKIGKSMAQDWPPADRPWRSVIVDESGQVVSSGFQKFGNYGEYEDDTELLINALASDEPVYMSEKADGSLIIRSVVRGEVIFRTRATFDGGDHGVAARRLAERKHPVLLDPSFDPKASLLFEFVSPDFRIIVPYPEDELILVGRVEHATLRQDDFPALEAIAQEHNFSIVTCHELPSEPEELIKAIEVWKGKEGVVARCNEGQTLVKLKAADYLARHRLRFALSARAVREICLERDVQNLDDFEVYLKEVGGDWELVEDAKPLVESFCAARARAQERLRGLATEVAAKLEELPLRKDFAIEYATRLEAPDKPAAFALADGKREQAYEIIEKAYLDQAFAKAEAEDALLEELEA